jgi:fermentation-respiration switch protein FrsA (DUF1100 family)
MGNIDSMIFQAPELEYTVEDLKKGIEDEIEVHFAYTYTNEKVCFCIIYPKIAKIIKKYVIWSYGNACDMLSMKEYAISFANKYQIAIVLYDYIGYGLSRSGGSENLLKHSNKKPSEQNCYDSLNSVISYFQKIRDGDIILVGQSLGTGVVVDYVAKNIYWDMPIILISPYKSIVSIQFSSFKYYLFSYFDRFNSYSKISNVFCPVKIFHGIDDALINFSHSQALFSRLRDKSYSPTFFANVGHNDILRHIDFSFLN